MTGDRFKTSKRDPMPSVRSERLSGVTVYVNKDVHTHTFRHSFAINSVRHGVDIRRLQQVLGHSNINTTAVYLRFNDQDLQDVYTNVPF